MKDPAGKRKGTGKLLVLSAVLILAGANNLFAQSYYFTDGYHGGVYGHYPYYVTKLILDNLDQNSYWAVNLEIEPETWDSVKVHDLEGYMRFTKNYEALQAANRVENVNPAYGQPYAWNISGESLIRHFFYGIREVKQHFPSSTFQTYSSEEPCFTSALPGILSAFGYSYAVLKNPNTCWGGYTSAYGGELVNWIGPDGTRMITVPRYGCEALEPGSTWQTTAWGGSEDYYTACVASGILNPVGMTFQDAGWKNGPWIKQKRISGKEVEYMTWTNYIRNHSLGTGGQDWHFSQEDVKVSLVWGSQVLQKLAQQVRYTENRIPAAEKVASLACIYDNAVWPAAQFDEAWRTLLLSQHHDCWIVPYNGRRGNTWADKVERWTTASNMICDSLIAASAGSDGNKAENKLPLVLRVYNTMTGERKDLARYPLGKGLINKKLMVTDTDGSEVLSQLVKDPESGEVSLLFQVTVPSMGFTEYLVTEEKAQIIKGAGARLLPDGSCIIETDLYKLELDALKGGCIQSLVARNIENREFVDHESTFAFNELRGFFYDEGVYHSSTEHPARISIVENGPLQVKVRIDGMIASQPFSQELTLVQGDRRIDVNLLINWQNAPHIGAWEETNFKAENPVKAFYIDSCKLLTLFPLDLEGPKVFKDAAFDVCESHLDNTFFSSWDSIRHNIIVSWVDFEDAGKDFGMALYSDHTTAYTHGSDFPAGLVIQYAGRGLWGRNYTVNGPTRVKYALLPHEGTWDESGIWSEGTRFKEPLEVLAVNGAGKGKLLSRSLLKTDRDGYELTAVTEEDGDLVFRLFNAESDASPLTVYAGFKARSAVLTDLNGNVISDIELRNDGEAGMKMVLEIPRFGFQTVRISR